MQKRLNRIYIMGTVGSGKTFLAKRLSEKLKIRHHDLDDIFWKRKFDKMRAEKERANMFNRLCNKKKWIIEGVYSTWIEIGVKKSDMVVLLDVPLTTLFWRITKRTLTREKSRRLGKERYRETFKGYYGLLRAVVRYKKKGFDRGFYKHKEIIDKHKVDFIVVKNKKQIKKFLESVNA